MKATHHLLTLCGAIFLAAGLPDLHAQSYPARTIRIIVPNPPGGTSDILARLIGAKMVESWGQQVIVENRAGGNPIIGSDFVARAAPDGYILLLRDIGGLTISPSVHPKLPFDPAKDFSPITMVAYSPHILCVHPSVPVKTVKDLIALAKARPGKLNYAAASLGGEPHLAGIDFALRTGIKWEYIPYKGGAQAIADTVAGHADVLFNGMLATYPHVQNGRLRLIAVSSSKRVAAIPDVPTVAESGVPGFETGSWQGILAPPGTLGEIVARLNAEVSRILNAPEMKEKLSTQGADVLTMSPEQFGAFIKNEMARWAKVVKASGAKFD
jgi:tripartite-type tricarboxylate transporter receptor subunit TctC